jgi:hypothetical protein
MPRPVAFLQRFGFFLGLAGLVVAAPVRADAPGSAADNAYWLVGSWVCHSRADSAGTATFARNADGSITLKALFGHGDRTGEFDETYRFDAKNGTWTWTSTQAGHPGLLETATAGPWTSQDWTFEGTEFAERIRQDKVVNARRIQRPLRMLFVNLNNASYERDFQAYVRGHWATFSSENCARTGATAPT